MKPDFSLLFTDSCERVNESQYWTRRVMRVLAEEIAQETGRPVALCEGYALPCNIVEKFG